MVALEWPSGHPGRRGEKCQECRVPHARPGGMSTHWCAPLCPAREQPPLARDGFRRRFKSCRLNWQRVFQAANWVVMNESVKLRPSGPCRPSLVPECMLTITSHYRDLRHHRVRVQRRQPHKHAVLFHLWFCRVCSVAGHTKHFAMCKRKESSKRRRCLGGLASGANSVRGYLPAARQAVFAGRGPVPRNSVSSGAASGCQSPEAPVPLLARALLAQGPSITSGDPTQTHKNR